METYQYKEKFFTMVKGPIADYAVEVKQTFPELNSAFNYKGVKIPAELWLEMVQFNLKGWKKIDAEVQISAYCNGKDWKAFPFHQEGVGLSTVEVKKEENDKIRDGLVKEGYDVDGFIFTLHNHCKTGAFQSGTDASDEADRPGIHVTIGHLDRDKLDIHTRVVLRHPAIRNEKGTIIAKAGLMTYTFEKEPFFFIDEKGKHYKQIEKAADTLGVKMEDALLSKSLAESNRYDFPEEWLTCVEKKKPQLIKGLGQQTGFQATMFGAGNPRQSYGDYISKTNQTNSQTNYQLTKNGEKNTSAASDTMGTEPEIICLPIYIEETMPQTWESFCAMAEGDEYETLRTILSEWMDKREIEILDEIAMFWHYGVRDKIKFRYIDRREVLQRAAQQIHENYNNEGNESWELLLTILKMYLLINVNSPEVKDHRLVLGLEDSDPIYQVIKETESMGIPRFRESGLSKFNAKMGELVIGMRKQNILWNDMSLETKLNLEKKAKMAPHCKEAKNYYETVLSSLPQEAMSVYDIYYTAGDDGIEIRSRYTTNQKPDPKRYDDPDQFKEDFFSCLYYWALGKEEKITITHNSKIQYGHRTNTTKETPANR